MNDSRKYRLADSTLIEPLVNCWSAWTNVIAPVPASLQLFRYQLPLLESYLQNPEHHISASREPDLSGGAFANIPAQKIGEAQELLNRTLLHCRDNLALARHLIEFHNFLVDQAHGESLEPFYWRLPQELRGYVELIYDYYHRPFMRFLEPLLYESHYYNPQLQSLRVSTLHHDDQRDNFLNTPRLHTAGQIDWPIEFNDPRVDWLFQLTSTPARLTDIQCNLGWDDASSKMLNAMLTDSPVRPSKTWQDDSVRVHYFGHASILFEWNGVSILADPVISVTPTAGGAERFSFADLPAKIDCVIVTHSHHDHFALESLLRLRHKIGSLILPRSIGFLYGDVSLKLLACKLGFKHVVELETFESFQIEDASVTAIPFLGEHADIAQGKTGYVIRMGDRQMLVAADSDCLDRCIYENVRSVIGDIDTVFLGMESLGAPLSFAYGSLLPNRPPREFDQSRRQHGCDYRRAVELLEAVGATRVYNYAMGLEPWMNHILGLRISEDSQQWRDSDKLLSLIRERGFEDARRLYLRDEIILQEKPFRRNAFASVPDLPDSDLQTSDLTDQFNF